MFFKLYHSSKEPRKLVIGVDEVGVGPLAGAVTAAAVTAPAKFLISNFSTRGGSASGGQFLNLRDSKQLTPKQRENFFNFFYILKQNKNIHWATASVMPRTIDRINIFQARRLAMARAVKKLARAMRILYKYDGNCTVLIDGNALLNIAVRQQAIIKGDEKIAIIAMASIIAKVTRDRAMVRYHKKYPKYRFDLHKGYGTRLHYAMLAQHGPCAIHRRSFNLTNY